MAYGRYKRYRRSKKSRRRTRRRARRAVRRIGRFRYRRYRKRSFNKISMSIFSKGTRANYVKLKSSYTWGDETSNPFITSSFGNFCVEGSLIGLGKVTRLLVSYPTLYLNFIRPSAASSATNFVSSIAQSLYSDYAMKYRFYKITGFKVKLYPKYPVSATPLAPTIGLAPSIAGSTVNLDVPIGVARPTTQMNAVPSFSAANNAGFVPVYDPAARRSIGFVAPFLSLDGVPFSSLTDNDLNKYLNSNYKRMVFKGGYQSIYYKCYRNTGDVIPGQLDVTELTSGTSSTVLVGWRPTEQTLYGFKSFDEQGIGILFPFSYRDLTTRYQITITTYFKFLYEKGAKSPND